MDNIEIIKETIKEMLETAKIEGQVLVDDSNENSYLVNIQTRDAGFLIGQAGANLEALQHIARVMVNKKSEGPVRFLLDINNYKRSRIELLEELAKNIAKQTLIDKVSVTLQAMPAHERRVIHLALAENPQIKTESIGEEPERKVIIKPFF